MQCSSSCFKEESCRLNEALRWTGVTIAKIVGISIAVFVFFSSGSEAHALMNNAIEAVAFLGFCRCIKEIFFSTQGNANNHAKPINHAVLLTNKEIL